MTLPVERKTSPAAAPSKWLTDVAAWAEGLVAAVAGYHGGGIERDCFKQWDPSSFRGAFPETGQAHQEDFLSAVDLVGRAVCRVRRVHVVDADHVDMMEKLLNTGLRLLLLAAKNTDGQTGFVLMGDFCRQLDELNKKMARDKENPGRPAWRLVYIRPSAERLMDLLDFEDLGKPAETFALNLFKCSLAERPWQGNRLMECLRSRSGIELRVPWKTRAAADPELADLLCMSILRYGQIWTHNDIDVVRRWKEKPDSMYSILGLFPDEALSKALKVNKRLKALPVVSEAAERFECRGVLQEVAGSHSFPPKPRRLV